MLKCHLFQWWQLLNFSVSHDLSEIFYICWFAAQETFLLLMLETVVLLNILWKLWSIFFGNYLLNKKLEHVFEICFLYNLTVFTVTFDPFNASLLNKNINFLKISLRGRIHLPQRWAVCRSPVEVHSLFPTLKTQLNTNKWSLPNEK